MVNFVNSKTILKDVFKEFSKRSFVRLLVKKKIAEMCSALRELIAAVLSFEFSNAGYFYSALPKKKLAQSTYTLYNLFHKEHDIIKFHYYKTCDLNNMVLFFIKTGGSTNGFLVAI